jgi:hypothetical protein
LLLELGDRCRQLGKRPVESEGKRQRSLRFGVDMASSFGPLAQEVRGNKELPCGS